MRDDDYVLHCGLCDQPIPALTGLEELQHIAMHLAEHHDWSVTLDEAIDLRIEWERARS